MKAASLKDIKLELKHLSKEDLMELCLTISKFKKDNKELLTYLLFEANDELEYIQEIKREITDAFKTINSTTPYQLKKGIRKILRIAKKQISYSKKKPTEIEIILHFCKELQNVINNERYNTSLIAIYEKQLEIISKKIKSLHEDMQFDYNLMMNELIDGEDNF